MAGTHSAFPTLSKAVTPLRRPGLLDKGKGRVVALATPTIQTPRGISTTSSTALTPTASRKPTPQAAATAAPFTLSASVSGPSTSRAAQKTTAASVLISTGQAVAATTRVKPKPRPRTKKQPDPPAETEERLVVLRNRAVDLGKEVDANLEELSDGSGEDMAPTDPAPHRRLVAPAPIVIDDSDDDDRPLVRESRSVRIELVSSDDEVELINGDNDMPPNNDDMQPSNNIQALDVNLIGGASTWNMSHPELFNANRDINPTTRMSRADVRPQSVQSIEPSADPFPFSSRLWYPT